MWICHRELLEFVGMSRLSQSDDVDANQLIALLKMKDEELQAILSKGLTYAKHLHGSPIKYSLLEKKL